SGCTTFNIPFWEGFNSDSSTEQCWTVLNENGDSDQWDMNYTSTPYEGNQVAMLYTDINSGNNDDWLISPNIDLTNTLGAARLKFHYKVQSRSEEHTSELQSRENLVCRLLLEKKKTNEVY